MHEGLIEIEPYDKHIIVDNFRFEIYTVRLETPATMKDYLNVDGFYMFIVGISMFRS